MFNPKLSLLSVGLMLVANAQAEPWQEKFYNPKPLEGDVILPMPCDGSMVFRIVNTETHSPLDEKSVILGSDGTADQVAEYTTPNYIAGGFENKGKSRYFLIAKYEISQLQYHSVMNTECPAANMKGRLPMTDISWFDAVEFSRKYNEWLLKNYPDKVPTEDNAKGFIRLPTEVEWEFASRGGAQVSSSEFRESVFPMKDGADKYIWGSKNANGKLQLTGLLEPNQIGLFDILGNASEMMFDSFKLNRLDHYHGQSGGVIVRGGSYLNTLENINNSYRIERPYYSANGDVDKAKDMGFRLVFAAPLLTSSQRINRLKDEWQKLGRDDQNGTEKGSNVVGQLEQLTADIKDQKLEKEELEKQLKHLNDTLRQANQTRDEQRNAAIQSSLRLGGFLCANIVDSSLLHQRALLLLDTIKDCSSDKNEAIGLCEKENVNNIKEKENKAKKVLDFNLKYYADTLVDTATLYNNGLIKAQVEPTKQSLLSRQKNNVDKFIQAYWEQLSQYQKDGKVDRDNWLKLCTQASKH